VNLLKSSGVLLAVSLAAFVPVADAGEPTGKGSAARGKAVFQVSGCWRCHNTDKPEARILRAGGAPAPSLMGIFKAPPHRLADGTRHEQHTDEMFRIIITEGTKSMAARGAALSDKEVNDLLAYLHTL
jgi:mono/diheme cytochrome c family protein